MKVGKWFMVAVLAIPMVITSALTLQAQNSNIENSNVERWRSFAQTLPRNATVRVTFVDGSQVEGRFQNVATDVINLLVETSPFGEDSRAVPLDKIASIEQRSGSRAIKIALIAAGVALAAVLWLAFSIHD